MSDIIIDLIKYFFFPGLVFAILLGFFVQWIDRKFFALAQQRVGPPISQPFWDFVKLLAKRDDKPEGATQEFVLLPPILFLLTFYVSFFIPIIGLKSVFVSFPGDLFFVIFLLTIHSGIIFLIGWSSRSPYTITGSVRTILTEMSIELPLVLSLTTVAIIAGSFQLTTISQTIWDKIFEQPLYLIPIVPLFLISLLIVTAILEKPPFDSGHAETEIVMGWQTEIKGKSLGLVNLSTDIYMWTVVGLIVTIFLSPNELWFFFPGTELVILGSSIDFLGITLNTFLFLIKVSIIVTIISLIRTSQARLRIDQIIKYFWRIFLPITLFSFALSIIIGGFTNG